MVFDVQFCLVYLIMTFRFVAIDTMHNLFLGTGKKMFKLWVESGILTHGTT